MATIDRIKAIRNRTSGSTGSSTLAKIQNIRAQTMPTFKTLEEAQTYANTNNINAVNTGVKLPTLATNVQPINIQTAISNATTKPNTAAQTFKNIGVGTVSTGANILEHMQDYNQATAWQDMQSGWMAQANKMLEDRAKGRSFAEAFVAGQAEAEKTEEKRKQERYEDTDKVTQALREAREKAIEDTDKLTGLNKKIAEAGLVVGDMLPTVGAGLVGGAPASSATLFMNAKQNAYNQAIDNGATHDQAYWNSMLSAGGELAIESLSGGALNKLTKIPGISNVSKLTQGIKSPLLRGGLNLVGDVVGEGGEEIVSTLVQPFIDRITYNPQAPTASMQEVWNSFTSSIIPTLMFGGINAGSTYIQKSVNKIANKQKAEIEKAQIPQEQKEILKKQVDEMAKVAEEEISAKTQKNIVPESAQMQETSVTNEVIPQEGVNQNTANVAQNTANAQNVVQNEANLTQKAIDLVQNSRISQSDKKSLIDTIKNMQVTEASFENLQNLIQTAESEIPQPYVNKTKLEQQKYAQYKNNPATYDVSFNEILEANPANKQGKRTKQQWLKVAEDFGKRLQGKTAEEIELNQYKTWQAVRPNTKDSLNRYGSAKQGDGTAKYVSFTLDEWKAAIAKGANQQNDTQVQQSLGIDQQKTQIPAEIQTFIDNRNRTSPGLKVEMDSTLNTDGVIIKNSDGTRTMRINPKSTRAYEFVAVHEMLHDLENTEAYRELAKFVNDRALTQEGFEKAKAAITEQYQRYYTENGLDMSKLNMEAETTNDMIAQALGNQEFLNELAGQKPTVFMRIYDWFKNVLFDGRSTGKTFSERRVDNKFLQELKKKFETAYNTAYKGVASEQTDFSIGGIKGVQNAAQNNVAFKRLEDNLKRAQHMARNGASNEFIRQNTNWFQDRNGEWKFEFSDKYMKLKPGVKLQENTRYKLGDILEHDLLFEFYPELENTNVVYEKTNRNINGSYSRKTNSILLNSKQTQKKKIEGTLIHEIQHAIQKIEKFKKDKYHKGDRLGYLKSIQEIEAADTKVRFLKERSGQLNTDLTPPEVSKVKPKHPELDNYLKNRTTRDKIRDGILRYFGGSRWISDAILEKDNERDSNANRVLVLGRERLEELEESSSFSLGDLEAFENKKQETYKKIADEFGRGANFWEANLEGLEKESAIRMLKRDTGVQNRFIETHDFEKVYKPVSYRALATAQTQNFVKENNVSFEELVNNEELTNKFLDVFEKELLSLGDSLEGAKRTKDMWKDYFEVQRYKYTKKEGTMRILKSFESDFDKILSGATQEVDNFETSKKLDKMETFNKYVESFVNPLYGEKPQLSTEELTELAQETFGVTTDFSVGAYMTPDGKLLDFRDGRSQYRNDHRDIDVIGYNMQEFIDAGNIRMKPEGNGFELAQEPTAEQYDTLSEYIDSLDGEVYIEIDLGKNKYDGANYKKGTSTNKIINDLQYYFKNGKFPIKSEFADFRYSQSNDEWAKYLSENWDLMPNARKAPTLRQQQAEQEAKRMNLKKPKLEEIAELTAENAQLPKGSYKQKADKMTAYRRKFWDNVESSKIIGQNIKDQVNMTNYERKTNDDTLNKMKERLDTDPVRLTQEWWAKDIKKATDQDIALGAILLERYQQEGRFDEAVDVVQKLADIGTEAGRTVQMYSIFQRLTPEGMQIYQQRKLNSALENITKKQTGKWVEQNKDKFKLTEDDATFITAKVQEAQNAPTERQKQIALAEIEKRINDKLPPEAGQSVKAFRRIAMLLNPKTQVRNVVGNTTVMPLNYVTDLVATGIDKAIAKKTGVRTTTLPSAKTMVQGAKKGLAETLDDYRKGIRTTPTGAKYEIQNNVKSFNENTGNKVADLVNRKLNSIDRILSTVMEAGDRPFYEAAYQNSLQGQMKANGVTEPTQDMIDIASNVALSQTWQDSNNYTQAVLGIRSAFNKINIHGFGLGDLIIPFAKTPANLTKAMVEYSPAGLIPTIINYNDMRKAISRGDMTPMQQKKFVTSVGKTAAGTLLYVLANSLVQSGAITGSSDEDKDVANFEKNVLGIQPYSIRIGDKTYTYNWAQPLAAPLAIMADAHKMSEEGAELNDILLNAIKVGGDQLVANSFLQGIQELLSSQYSNESMMDNLVGAIMDLPTQFTPTLLGQIATYTDATKRQTYENGDAVGTMVNEVKNKIPGKKETLAPQVNTFGEEILNYGGDNSAFNVFLNPGNISSANATDTQKELYALYEATQDTTIFPRQAPYSVSGGGEKVSLSSKDRAEYQKASGTYVTEHLDALFDSDFYKSLENEQKAEIVNKIVSDADTTAKSKWVETTTTAQLADKQEKLENAGIPLVDYYNSWAAQKDIEGIPGPNGKILSGSKSRLKKEAIDKATADLDKYQRRVLYEMFNIGESVW